MGGYLNRRSTTASGTNSLYVAKTGWNTFGQLSPQYCTDIYIYIERERERETKHSRPWKSLQAKYNAGWHRREWTSFGERLTEPEADARLLRVFLSLKINTGRETDLYSSQINREQASQHTSGPVSTPSRQQDIGARWKKRPKMISGSVIRCASLHGIWQIFVIPIISRRSDRIKIM